MPIIDYHCHLPPCQIAEDSRFDNIVKAWLDGDHYKWRAMRANGVDESYITGDRPDREKFRKWAQTVPYTLRNPLYHWSHLELRRYFGITKLLTPDTADAIFDETREKLQSAEFSTRGLIRKMNVEVICTTDDPVDRLEFHRQLQQEGYEVAVYPAFRPDEAMEITDPASFHSYLERLRAVSGIRITDYGQYLEALKNRHRYFDNMGCRLSDHGIEEIYVEDYTPEEIVRIFQRALDGERVSFLEARKFKSALLYWFAVCDAEAGWVQQYHLGALRNNNTRMMRKMGPNTGWDSIGDFRQATPLATFLDRLDRKGQLAKTILYNLNPADNEVLATMTGNFNDGSVPGKIQFGAAWWFLDQKDGMTRQLNAVSNMGLLSRFVGMLTDSRSFLSYPRHEYFRRLLCDLLGSEMERGELPRDEPWIGQIVQDICYRNALNYFGWKK